MSEVYLYSRTLDADVVTRLELDIFYSSSQRQEPARPPRHHRPVHLPRLPRHRRPVHHARPVHLARPHHHRQPQHLARPARQVQKTHYLLKIASFRSISWTLRRADSLARSSLVLSTTKILSKAYYFDYFKQTNVFFFYLAKYSAFIFLPPSYLRIQIGNRPLIVSPHLT